VGPILVGRRSHSGARARKEGIAGDIGGAVTPGKKKEGEREALTRGARRSVRERGGREEQARARAGKKKRWAGSAHAGRKREESWARVGLGQEGKEREPVRERREGAVGLG
jgi:hypothetical protein